MPTPAPASAATTPCGKERDEPTDQRGEGGSEAVIAQRVADLLRKCGAIGHDDPFGCRASIECEEHAEHGVCASVCCDGNDAVDCLRPSNCEVRLAWGMPTCVTALAKVTVVRQCDLRKVARSLNGFGGETVVGYLGTSAQMVVRN
ncbi:MAG: hypothetical protein Q8O82_13100 [Pseudorhodobacter sp.]|nr:hypothetical protein [Pseudorhodobacter sp.]